MSGHGHGHRRLAIALAWGASLTLALSGCSNRDEILSSRLDTTRALHRAVERASTPPRVWLNSSTATIYRHATDRPQTEAGGELGEGHRAVLLRKGWREDACPAHH